MKLRIFSLLMFCIVLGTNLSYGQKSANLFIHLLETYDYWEQASTKNGDAQPPNKLSELQNKNSRLNKILSYSRVHLDYGYQRKEKDPMHDFTVLEIEFKNRNYISFADSNMIQLYPNCIGSNQFEELIKSEKKQIFPLWEFKELVHEEEINWGYREYIRWSAIRYENFIYVIYTIPVANMGEIPNYTQLLYDYLLINSVERMQQFIFNLKESKYSSLISYDFVEELQIMLKSIGYNVGKIDGVYGNNTENALSNLLFKLNYLEEKNCDLKKICCALKKFQDDYMIKEKECFGNETIRKLKEIYKINN